MRRGPGDVSELTPDATELEEAAGALEAVLGLRQLAGLEGGRQGVVRDGDRRRKRPLLLLRPRGGRSHEQEQAEAGHEARAPHRSFG